MQKTALLILFIAITTTGLTQDLKGTVLDKETNQPLPYVHIGIAKKGIGTISDEQGHFSLSIPSATSKDIIQFSMLGYESYQLSPGDNTGSVVIKLKPSIIQLREVVVKDKKTNQPQHKFGRTKPIKTSTGASGISDYGVGQEIGTFIKNDGKKYVLNSINFHLKFNTVDSILYRINIYAVENQLPTHSLLNQELFVTAQKRDKWVELIVANQFILFDQDIFVSIELVRRWNNDGNNNLFYSSGKGCVECWDLIRPTSQAEWTTNFSFPLAIYITAEELEGL